MNQPTPASPNTKSSQPSSQSAITEFAKPTTKYNSTDPRQVDITDALVLYIAGDLAPLSAVNSPYFANLVAKLDPRYQLPSRKHLSSKLLSDKSASVESELKDSLRTAPSVCLTIDLWSNRQMRGFMGVTGHYIHDWVMQSVMIACKRFKGRHTADNIRQEYEEIVSTYEISDKVITIVTDNASNMTKAFKFPLPGYVTEKETDADEDSDSDSEDSPDPSEDGASSQEDPLTSVYPHTVAATLTACNLW